MYDPDLYRDKSEVERWKLRDPIALFADRLEHDGILTADDRDAIDRAATSRVDEAVSYAERGTAEPLEELTRFVVSEVVG
jgi:pyruvate dehydrogenase E1 component alpha subunit